MIRSVMADTHVYNKEPLIRRRLNETYLGINVISKSSSKPVLRPIGGGLCDVLCITVMVINVAKMCSRTGDGAVPDSAFDQI